MWIYHEKATEDVLRFDLDSGQRTDCRLEFGLNFTGWRTVWVRYAYDMQGRPRPGMDTVRIIAPRHPGTLFVDQLLRIRGGSTVVAVRTVDGRPVQCRLAKE